MIQQSLIREKYHERLVHNLTASSDGTFIYELLQNANDYPMEDESGNPIPVNVEFHITGEYLIYRHSGDFFTYNRQIKKFPTEKQNVSLKHILT